MYSNLPVQFRQDLVITQTQRQGDQSQCYLVQDPNSGETFEFGEEEFYLCQSMDGKSTPIQIINQFKNQFNISLNEKDFQGFVDQVYDMGLLEVLETPTPELPPQQVESESVESPPQDLVSMAESDRHEAVPTINSTLKTIFLPENKPRRWKLINPAAIFDKLVLLTRLLKIIFILLVWLLIPGVPLAFFVFFDNQYLLWQDIAVLKEPLSYLGSLCFSLILVNLLSRLALGTVCTYYGGNVEELGLRLRFGIIPRFYIDTKDIKHFNREGKLWTYGTAILFRLTLFVAGVLIWYGFRATGTQLGIWAILLAQAGLIGLLIVGLPIRTSYGYRWLVTYFNLPPNLLQRSLQVLMISFSRRQTPTSISTREKLGLLAYAIILLGVWGILAVKITTSIASGLVSTFPNILGRSTSFIILCLVILMVWRWAIPKILKLKGKRDNTQSSFVEDSNRESDDVINRSQPSRLKFSKGIKLLLLFGLCIVLLIPFPYRPGGQIQLLPPKQQQIQAPVSGKIVQVLFNGGDGQFIQSGTKIATITSTELENNILTLQEQIKGQQATLETKQYNLKKLLATPRVEEVEVARKPIEIAKEELEATQALLAQTREELEVARKRLEAAIVRARYSQEEVSRLESLYQEGAFALQRLEEAKKQAETDQIAIEANRKRLSAQQKAVEEISKSLSAKQKILEEAQAKLNLVLAGTPPDDIEAARQEVEATRAELNRLQQELKYAQEKRQSTQLVMPLDGYLIDPYLNRKIGSYINQGDNFAVAQDKQKNLGEIELPEYDAGEIPVGTKAEVKLLAYPNDPIIGKVISVEPATSEEAYGRVVNVVIEFDNPEKELKSGMSGYGKIHVGKKPLIVLLTRPIIRFIQIELWSWLP